MFAVMIKERYCPMTMETPNNADLHQTLPHTRRVRQYFLLTLQGINITYYVTLKYKY